LQGNEGLVEDFITIYTEKKGIPDEMKSLSAWLSNIMVEDEESKLRLIGVGGGWQERLSPHVAEWSGHTSPRKQSDWCKAVLATDKNILGLKAFDSGDRSTALKAFTEAIEDLIEVLSRNPDFTNQNANLAALYCNRADTWLLSEFAVDATAAVRDAQIAQTLQPAFSYG
jgi:hypothetical protein